MLLVTPVIGTRGRHLDDPTPDAVTRRSDLHGWHPRRERRWITNSAGVKPAGTCICCRNDHTNVRAHAHHPRGGRPASPRKPARAHAEPSSSTTGPRPASAEVTRSAGTRKI